MYILFAIIFIAELIIALQIIFLIRKADKKVCDFNECIKAFNPLAKTYLQYIRGLSKNFCGNISKSINLFKKQQKKFVIKIISSFAIYVMLLFFKTKKLKIKKIYGLVGAIRDIAINLAI